jgi:ABC-type glycerol-3-phosphate transport system substrate-binding protein
VGKTIGSRTHGTTRRGFIGRLAQAGIVLGPLGPIVVHGSPAAAESQGSIAPAPLADSAHGIARQDLQGTLTFFHYDSFSNPNGEALLADYAKSQPGVKIELVPMPPGEPMPYINAMLAGGTAPDLMTLATNEQPWKDIKKGFWLDLTEYAQAPNPYVSGNTRWIDLLTPSAASQLPFSDGHLYSMTTTGFDVAFIYNKTIFTELGVEAPKTWSELKSILQKAQAAGYIPFFAELGDQSYGGQFPGFITILEDTVMDASIQKMDANQDGVVDVKELIEGIRNKTYSAQNEDYQESWKLLSSLSPYFQRGALAATGSDDGFNAFKSGRVATWFEGSFNANALNNRTDVEWAAFPMPDLTSQDTKLVTEGPQRKGSFGACCGYPWAIPATTKDHGTLELALDFIYWLSIPENTDHFASGAGVLSVLQDAAPDSELAAFAEAASGVSRLAVAELSLPPEFLNTRARLVGEFVGGQSPLDQAMAQMQDAMNQAADQAVEMYGFDL